MFFFSEVNFQFNCFELSRFGSLCGNFTAAGVMIKEAIRGIEKSRSLAQTLNKSPEWSASQISLACTALISVVDRGSDLFRTTSCDFGRVYLFSDAAVWFRTGQSI